LNITLYVKHQAKLTHIVQIVMDPVNSSYIG